jgi:hypothetical protein
MNAKKSKAVIEDMERFNAFLAAQPLCAWSAQKQHEIAAGTYDDKKRPAAGASAKNDNAELAAALSSMA